MRQAGSMGCTHNGVLGKGIGTFTACSPQTNRNRPCGCPPLPEPAIGRVSNQHRAVVQADQAAHAPSKECFVPRPVPVPLSLAAGARQSAHTAASVHQPDACVSGVCYHKCAAALRQCAGGSGAVEARLGSGAVAIAGLALTTS